MTTETIPTVFKVGDGATICHYTDRTACTVVKVSPSGKTIWLQADEVTLQENWKPDIIPGGFSGHCVNNSDQVYNYKPNTNAAMSRATIRQNGKMTTSFNERVITGRHHFYDYNF